MFELWRRTGVLWRSLTTVPQTLGVCDVKDAHQLLFVINIKSVFIARVLTTGYVVCQHNLAVWYCAIRYGYNSWCSYHVSFNWRHMCHRITVDWTWAENSENWALCSMDFQAATRRIKRAYWCSVWTTQVSTCTLHVSHIHMHVFLRKSSALLQCGVDTWFVCGFKR